MTSRPQRRAPSTSRKLPSGRSSLEIDRAIRAVRRTAHGAARVLLGAASIAIVVLILAFGLPRLAEFASRLAPSRSVSANSDSHRDGTPAGSALAETLRMPNNTAFRAWLSKPVAELTKPSPRIIALPHSAWTDESNSIDVIDGVRWKSERPPDRFEIRSSIDAALAEAIDRQFGIPGDYEPPRYWYYEGDGGRAALQGAMNSRRERVRRAHGFVDRADSVAPDYEWLIDHSRDACRPIAEEILRSVNGRGPRATDARTRVEALTSYVQNAIPYIRDFDDERSQLHGDASGRFGLMTPLMTLIRGGDCDSKSMLLASLIRSVDREVPLLLVTCRTPGTENGPVEDHALLAVGIPAQADEQTLIWESVEYVLIETTSDWGVGSLSEDTELANCSVDRLR
jgi:hypothetical protein